MPRKAKRERTRKFQLLHETHPDVYKLIDRLAHPDEEPLKKVCSHSTKELQFRCPYSCEICFTEHIWTASVASQTNGRGGCPWCRGWKLFCVCLSVFQNATLMKEWHTEKNDGIDPHQLSIHSTTPVWWKCSKHTTCSAHEWNVAISERKRYNCPFCSRHSSKYICQCSSILAKDPDMLQYLHPTRNAGLDLTKLTAGSDQKLWWKCVTHTSCDLHEWEAPTYARKQSGCPWCSNKKMVCPCNAIVNDATLKSELDVAANAAEGIDTMKISYASSKMVNWICKKGHKWKAIVANRTGVNKTGCPHCSQSLNVKECCDELRRLKIKYEADKRFPDCKNKRALPFDIWIPSLQACIEVDGSQHFHEKWAIKYQSESLPNRRKRDQIKNEYCASKRLHLLRISARKPEHVAHHLNQFVTDIENKLKPHIMRFVGSEYAKPEYVKCSGVEIITMARKRREQKETKEAPIQPEEEEDEQEDETEGPEEYEAFEHEAESIAEEEPEVPFDEHKHGDQKERTSSQSHPSKRRKTSE